jgi:hypothetical protein
MQVAMSTSKFPANLTDAWAEGGVRSATLEKNKFMSCSLENLNTLQTSRENQRIAKTKGKEL